MSSGNSMTDETFLGQVHVLHRAVLTDFLPQVKLLMEKLSEDRLHFVLKHRDPLDDGKTLLHQAAEHGHVQVLCYLVESCLTDLTLPLNVAANPSTPAHLAAERGHLDVVSHLVAKNRGLLEMKGKYGQTLLGSAVSFNQFEVAKFLVCEAKCNIEARDSTSHTPIMSAAKMGYAEIVQLLSENGADFSPLGPGLEVAAIAASNNQVEVLRYFLSIGLTSLREGGALGAAASHNCLAAVQFLVEEAGCGREEVCRDFILNNAALCGNEKRALICYLVDIFPGIIEESCANNPHDAELIRLILAGTSDEDLGEIRAKSSAYFYEDELAEQQAEQ